MARLLGVTKREPATSDLLTDLGDEVADKLFALGHRVSLSPNQTLFFEGDTAQEVYLPLSGHLKATLLSSDGDERIVAVFRPGELLGEMAPLEAGLRSATVSSIKTAELRAWPQAVFFEFADREPVLWRHISKTLSQRLRDLNAVHTARHFLPFKGQLAVLLLQLAKDLGVQDTGAGVRIDLKLTQSDLAEMLGATREYVGKAVNALTKDNVISKSDGFYVVQASDPLERLAEGLRQSEP